MKKFLDLKAILLVIILLGFLMRLVVLNQSFWLDEAIGVIAAKTLTFKEIAINFVKTDNHPPLYYLLLKLWGNNLGYSEISVRLLSILFSTLTLMVVYKICQLFNKNKSQSLLIILFLATSPFYIYYSQEARMYSLAALGASFCLWSFLLILKKENINKFLPWFFFSFFVVFLIFSDYVPIFLLPIFFLYALYSKKNITWWKRFLISFMPLMIIGFFWIPVVLAQGERGRTLISTLPSWLKVAGGANLKQLVLVWTKFTLGRISFYPKVLYYSLIAIFSVPFMISFLSALKKIKENFLIWLWLVIPLALGFVVSFLFPVFIYFRFLFILPAFYFLISVGILNFKNKLVRIILITALLIVNLTGWLIYVKDPSQQREMWREAVKLIESKAKDNEIAIFNYPESFAPYRWYATKVRGVGVADSISVHKEKTETLTKLTVKDKRGIYYFEYLWQLSDPDRVVEETLKSQGFIRKEVYNFNGVGLISYWQK